MNGLLQHIAPVKIVMIQSMAGARTLKHRSYCSYKGQSALFISTDKKVEIYDMQQVRGWISTKWNILWAKTFGQECLKSLPVNTNECAVTSSSLHPSV